MDNIYKYINSFVNYGIDKNLIDEYDAMYIINNLLRVLNINEYQCPFERKENSLQIDEILEGLINYSIDNGIIENYSYQKDLFDTLIMDLVTPYPSTVINNFFDLYQINPIEATNYFYNLMIACNYIRINRINKNIIFKSNCQYGDILITINLSKPEKDPKEIAKLKLLGNVNNYPKCLLCYENVGFSGNEKLQARNNLRVIPIELNNERFYMQYSPYIYYNEHCIVFKDNHQDMIINEDTFKRLLDFLDMFPHYFIGSNADLPIVGGSILVHEHYQGGNFIFPLDKATVKYKDVYGNVTINYLNWPLDCLQLISDNKKDIINVANKILLKWKAYSNKDLLIYNRSEKGVHNTITPIARFIEGKYILTLVLRNNYTDEDHPYGLFHPDVSLHHIKKENIGLIEVMGLAILPGRLKQELKLIDDILKGRETEENINKISYHKDWYEELKEKENLDLYREVANKFVSVLESCQVFKYGTIKDVIKFIDSIK